MKLSGWGNYPGVEAEALFPRTAAELTDCVASGFSGIARGLGRSYGDSALATQVLSTRHLDHILSFDPESGQLGCEAGISLDTLIRVFAPRGWFPAVVPGTRHVSVGGAIASDVHGKNHHGAGCFSEYVESLEVITGDGSLRTCSRKQDAELFHAVCGGMGLTGIIVRAVICMARIPGGNIAQQTIRSGSLEASLEQFEAHSNATYSAAWIDCIGKTAGRSVLLIGEHAHDSASYRNRKEPRTLPFALPSFSLNRLSGRAFNALYYSRAPEMPTEDTVSLDQFFFPLDGIGNWNRVYGKNGFLQYQLVIPTAAGISAVREIMNDISSSDFPCFLAVLKVFGPENRNLLSFPTEGYTLALDFKYDPGLMPFLERMDEKVIDFGGRIYLTKDARMSEKIFRRSYPKWEEFASIREKTGSRNIFHSLQSDRLGL